MNNQHNSAFTLIEALIAISLLMVAIVSPLTIVKKSLVTAALSQDQMTASFLAQDAIEAVKNVRDKTAINENSGDWLAGLGSCMCVSAETCDFDNVSATYCNIDTTIKDLDSSAIKAQSDSAANPMKIATTTDTNGNPVFIKYDLSSAASSVFSRKINIKKSADNTNEALIKVRVSWTSAIGVQKVDINNFIYNFSENL